MNKFNILAGACLLALGLASTAQAGEEAVGSCPRGGDWSLTPKTTAIVGLDVGNTRNLDRNADGYICVRTNRGLTARNGQETLVVKDNNGPLRNAD